VPAELHPKGRRGQRKAIVYSQQAPAGRLEQVLRTQNPDIEIPLSAVLPA
jgi:hypothetical protein